MFVKICGLTSEEDALLAVAMGADAVGFVFAPSSRQIAPQKVADIVKRLPVDITTVGVFRDEAAQRVTDIVHHSGLRAAQLHGFESPNEARWIRQRIRTVFKAFPAGDPRLDHADDWGADVIVIDSPAGGGSGEVFDWTLAEGAPSNRRILLAGGLTHVNVGEAIRRVKPWGVDVSTGVEASPGHKDARKLKAFIDAARAAAREVEPPDPDPDTAHRPFDWADDLS